MTQTVYGRMEEGCSTWHGATLSPSLTAVEVEVLIELRVACPSHGRVVDAVDGAVRGLLVESVRHALHIGVAVQVLKGVLKDGDVNIGQEHLEGVWGEGAAEVHAGWQHRHLAGAPDGSVREF